jgi:hypothetical protein
MTKQSKRRLPANQTKAEDGDEQCTFAINQKPGRKGNVGS